MTEPRAQTSIQPRVLERADAAVYCALSVNSFDKAVREGELPQPIEYRAIKKRVWDRLALDEIFDKMTDTSQTSGVYDPWD